jgi:hypothetical protein
MHNTARMRAGEGKQRGQGRGRGWARGGGDGKSGQQERAMDFGKKTALEWRTGGTVCHVGDAITLLNGRVLYLQMFGEYSTSTLNLWLRSTCAFFLLTYM